MPTAAFTTDTAHGVPLDFHGELKPHQPRALQFLLETPKALLADDVGLGKTVEVLAYLATLDRTGELYGPKCRVMWLTDASLLEQTKRAVQRFTPTLSVLTTNDPELRLTSAKARLAYADQFPYGPDVLITSYDKAKSLRHGMSARWGGYSVLVLDEVMSLKGNGVRHDVALELGERVPRIVAMTATPYENNPLETHAVLQLLHLPDLWHRTVFERDFVDFEPGYEIHTSFGTKYVPAKARGIKPHAVPILRDYLSRVMLRRTAASVGLPMPEQVGEPYRWVSLSPAQQADYQRLANSKGLAAHAQRTAIGRAAGAVSSLVDALMEELDARQSEQVIVYCETLQVLEMVSERLAAEGIVHRSIEGKNTAAHRDDAIAAFREDPAVRVLLASRVLERGLDLQHARVLISLDASYNPARERQREGRIRRIGSPHQTYEHLTILPDTPVVWNKVGTLDQRTTQADLLLGPITE